MAEHTYNPGTFPKPCRCCGASYSQEEWLELVSKGSVDYGHGFFLEYRDCACGNTMTVAVASMTARLERIVARFGKVEDEGEGK